jgi:hypothetical protein
MLWFPEFFGRWMPGWMFNVATIFHAYEAMLAAAFLFTIHFFNVHLRPDKFPLDAVMFTGRATLDYMEEEHPAMMDQIEAVATSPSRRSHRRPAGAAADPDTDAGRRHLRVRGLGYRTRHHRDDSMGRFLLIASLVLCRRGLRRGGARPGRPARRPACAACHQGATGERGRAMVPEATCTSAGATATVGRPRSGSPP